MWGIIHWFAGTTVLWFETKAAIVHWTTFLAVFIIGEFIFRDRSVSHWFRSAMLWFGFLVAILATFQNFTSGGKVFWVFPSGSAYLMGPIPYHNHYAAFIEGVLPIALYRTFRGERGTLLYGSMVAILYASIIASASRAGTVLATSDIIVTAIMWRRSQTTRLVVGSAALKVLVLSVVCTLVVGWGVVWQRFAISDPYSGRRELAAISSLHMAADRPWLGFGLGTWPTVYPQYASFDVGSFNRAHCDWLEWTAEGGFPFGFLIATIFLWSLRPAFRTVWGLGVVSVFLHATVDYPFSRPALGAWPIRSSRCSLPAVFHPQRKCLRARRERWACPGCRLLRTVARPKTNVSAPNGQFLEGAL